MVSHLPAFLDSLGLLGQCTAQTDVSQDPGFKQMKRVLCKALIVISAACTLKVQAHSVGVTEPRQERAGVAPQTTAGEGSGVLKASIQQGQTADVQISSAIAAMARRN